MSELNRARWRSRRGMLELDLLLSAFVERHYSELDSAQKNDYSDLLEYPDNELWDIITGKARADARLQGIVDLIATDRGPSPIRESYGK